MVRKADNTGFPGIAVLLGAMALLVAGCTGGTTYGTGVSQGKQTVNDLYNILALKRKTPTIDYSSRPDLIVPQKTAALPEPVDVEATTSNPEWPETPEQRIARIRAQAGEADPRSGEYSIEERLRKKEGIAIETRDTRPRFIPGKTDRFGKSLNPSLDEAARDEVLKRKAELKGVGVAPRRFLTEPPVEYRTPYASAPTGKDAYTESEIQARDEEAKEERIRKAQKYGRGG